MSTYREGVLEYLTHKAESDKAAALASFELLLNNAVGIGDHSTDDLYKEFDAALNKLVDAEDRLSTLAKHFGA